MEWATEESLRCSGCGWPRDISMAKGADEDFEVEAMQCHVCAAIHTKHKGWKGDNLPAVHFHARHTGSDRASP